MLLGFVISGLVAKWTAAISVPIAIVAVAKLALSVDTKLENRKRAAIEISKKLGDNGFDLFEELLESFAVGDKSGMLRTLVELAKVVKDPETFDSHFSKLFTIQLAKRVKEPATRIEVARALRDAEVLENADLKDRNALGQFVKKNKK